MPDYQIDLLVAPNAERFPSELEAAVARAEERQPPVAVELMPKLAPGFERETKALTKEALARLDAQVLISPKLAKSFRSDVEKLVKEATKGTGIEVAVQAKLGPGFRAKLQRLVTEEMKAAPIEMPVAPQLDQRRYAKFVEDFRGRLDAASASGVTSIDVKPELMPGFTADLSAKVAAATETASAGAVIGASVTATPTVSSGLTPTSATLAKTGKDLTKYVTLPIVAIGAAAVFSAVQVDNAYRTIQQRTGATGSTLTGLEHVFDAVDKKSGASFGHIADILTQFNQRLGLTGKPLQDFVGQFLVLERVAGTGAPSVDAVAKAMVGWHVATRDQSAELDRLFVASQKTGVPMSALVDDVTKFGPQLRAANLTLDQSTVLMGTLEKSGVPVGKLFLGINTYLAKVAKSGGDTSTAFQDIINKAVGLDKLGKAGQGQALMLLVDAFGSRAGITIAQLVKEGKLSGPIFAELGHQIAGSTGEIQRVGDATIPLSVRLSRAWKTVELDMAPVGEKIIPVLIRGLGVIVPLVTGIFDAFSHLPSGVQDGLLVVAAFAAAAGPAITVVTRLSAAVKLLWGGLQLGLGIGKQVAASIAEIDFSLEGLAAATATTLPILAAVGAVVYIAAEAWGSYHEKTNQVYNLSADSSKWASRTIADMKATGASVNAAFTKEVLKPWWLDSQFSYSDNPRAMTKALGFTMDELRGKLQLTGSAWTDFVKAQNKREGYDAGKAYLNALHDSYQQALLSTKGLAAAQAPLYVALSATGKSMSGVISDAQKLRDAVSTKEFKKSGLAPEMLISNMRLLGLSVQDVTKKGFNWSKFKKDIDAMNKYMDGVQQTWAGFTDLLSIETPSTDKKIQAAQDAVTKAQAAVAASHGKAVASTSAADQRAHLTSLRETNTLIDAQDSLNKLVADPHARPEAIASAERRLQIAQESAKTVGTTGRAAAGAAGPMQRLADAQKKLANLQESVGVSGIKQFYKDRLFEAGSFVSDIDKAWKMGYDPSLISRIITAGPEKAGKQLHTLVSTSSTDLVSIVNTGEKKLQEITSMALEQAHLQELAMHPIKDDPTGAIGRFMRANVGAASLANKFTSDAKPLTVSELAAVTGLSPENAQQLAIDFQLPFRQNPPIDTNTMKQQIWDFKMGVKNDPGAVLKLDVNPGEANKGLRGLKERIDNSSGSVKIDGIPVSAIEQLTGTIVKINAAKGTVTLDADQQAGLLKLIAWQNAAKKTKGTATLDAENRAAMLKLAEVQHAIEAIPFVGSDLAKSLAASLAYQKSDPRLVSGQAHGAVFEDHSPQIVPGGAWRVFGEPETEGESYIPHARSKRKRSIDLWAQTGRILGIPGFADGAVIDNGSVVSPLVAGIDAAIAKLGGQRVLAAGQFATSQVGKPYVWGAVGPDAYDCSGLWSAILNVAMGSPSPYRRLFTSASLPAVAAALGLLPGTAGPLAIGDKPGSHVAGTLAGTNFEATPPKVISGAAARGAASTFFSQTFNLPAGAFVQGSKLPTVTGGDFGAGGGGSTGGGSGPIPALGLGLIGRILGTIGWMESGDNPTARNKSGSASGEFQMTDGTWGGFGGFAHAYLAPLAVQIQKATQMVTAYLAGAHGDVLAIPELWYLGHRPTAAEMNRVPPGGNRLTPSQYDAEWMAAFARVQGFENGGLLTRDGLYRGAEGNKPELVLPLTQPSRMRQLIEDHALTDMFTNGGSSSRQSSGPTIEGDVILQVTPPASSDPELFAMSLSHRIVPVLASGLARIGG